MRWGAQLRGTEQICKSCPHPSLPICLWWRSWCWGEVAKWLWQPTSASRQSTGLTQCLLEEKRNQICFNTQKTPKDWLDFSRKKPGAASLATGRLGNHGMGSLEQRNLLGLGKKSQSLVEDKAPALPWLWGLQRPAQPWWLCLPSAPAEPSQRWAGAQGSVLRLLTTCTGTSWDSQHGVF